jgi:glyoxylase-like metal-dependent hydrolase (beta-lactamase superfamily II)
MEIIRISPKGFGANTYLLHKSDGAIVIDPAGAHVVKAVEERGVKVEHVLLTHCHFDHVAGVNALQELGAKVHIGKEELPLVGTRADLFELFGAPRVPYRVDETFAEGEEKTLCGIKITALHTPGHTAGSICYLVEDEGKKYLFSGDTLFAGTIGRTDFPTGNIGEMQQRLRRLSALEDMPVYAGHEEPTTIARERKENPFME